MLRILSLGYYFRDNIVILQIDVVPSHHVFLWFCTHILVIFEFWWFFSSLIVFGIIVNIKLDIVYESI